MNELINPVDNGDHFPDISQDQCDAYFFMRAGGLVDLISAFSLGIKYYDPEATGKLITEVGRDITPSISIVATTIKKHNLRGRGHLIAILMACDFVSEFAQGLAENLNYQFVTDGMDQSKANSEAVLGTSRIMGELFTDRDESLRSQSEAFQTPRQKARYALLAPNVEA